MDRVKLIQKDVTNEWRPIVFHDSSKFLEIIKGLDEVTPRYENILEFAKYSFRNIKVVIIGQDPYPTPGDAHGLSFSTLSDKCPKSLFNIFSALIESKLIDERPKTFDLTHWARQGIVLLNTAWTTVPGKSNSHQDVWSAYTDEVIKLISKHAHQPLMWLLWGAFAQKKREFIDEKRKFPDGNSHTVLEHCHPVAMVNPSFKYCTHFTEITKRYPEIIWLNKPIETVWYTDGACKGNQFRSKGTARAAWGAVCTKGPLSGKSWGEPLPALVKVDYKGNMEDTPPSNIRAECLALIHVMTTIYKTGVVGRHLICSDSKFWIEDMLNYIQGWIKNEIPFNKKKNSDLTTRFWKIYNMVKPLGLEFKFVQAWHDYSRPAKDPEDWEGNKLAEETAERHLPTSRRD